MLEPYECAAKSEKEITGNQERIIEASLRRRSRCLNVHCRAYTIVYMDHVTEVKDSTSKLKRQMMLEANHIPTTTWTD